MKKIEFFDGPYAFLSNFIGGVEQKFQAEKTLDKATRKRILGLPPGEAKQLGNAIRLRPDWEEIKYGVMERLVREKFNRPRYRIMLLRTGDAEIVEGNTWHDHIWGNCVCERCQAKGPGKNWLGLILTKVRSELASKHR